MKRFSLILFLFLCCDYSIGQTGFDESNFAAKVDFLPPAPNASAIVKQGILNVNRNTGSPNFSIPLLQTGSNKISVSVALSYSSTGIKVDEIASRAGMGWVLNAGGVITRTIRGAQDEISERLEPPAQFGDDCGTFNFMYKLTNTNGAYDAEPDLYNFNMNGHSGSFVYDNAGVPVLIPVMKYIITRGSVEDGWSFCITTTDGIKYFFGGEGATEKTKRITSCGRPFGNFIENAWYLKRIEHPSGEIIDFSYDQLSYKYDNGISQTIHAKDFSGMLPIAECPIGESISCTCPMGECPPPPPVQMCINFVQTDGVLLKRIDVSTSESIAFEYIERLDCEDRLFSRVIHINHGMVVKSWRFNYGQQQADLSYANGISPGYNYTPYLASISEVSSDELSERKHGFTYNSPADRAPRLSFSQDHWGYFNGKVD